MMTAEKNAFLDPPADPPMTAEQARASDVWNWCEVSREAGVLKIKIRTEMEVRLPPEVVADNVGDVTSSEAVGRLVATMTHQRVETDVDEIMAVLGFKVADFLEAERSTG